jgi:hypothetical protein
MSELKRPYRQNSNIKIQNSKQIQNPNVKMIKVISLITSCFEHYDFLVIVSNFELRISNLCIKQVFRSDTN